MWRWRSCRDIEKRFPVLMLCLALKWFNGREILLPRLSRLAASIPLTWTRLWRSLIYDSYLIIVNNFPHCLFLFSWRSLTLCGALFKQKGKERGSACQMRETFLASRFSVSCIRSEEKFSLLSRLFFGRMMEDLTFCDMLREKKRHLAWLQTWRINGKKLGLCGMMLINSALRRVVLKCAKTFNWVTVYACKSEPAQEWNWCVLEMSEAWRKGYVEIRSTLTSKLYNHVCKYNLLNIYFYVLIIFHSLLWNFYDFFVHKMRTFRLRLR